MLKTSYELSHEREYHAIRGSAALLDISPLYKDGTVTRLDEQTVE